MISDAANRLAGVIFKVARQTSAVVAGTKAAVRMRAVLLATIVVILALALSTSARAATITIDSLADTGASGICVLRDAITAANTKTAVHGCVAGDDNDTIRFSIRGTIALSSTLPQVTDTQLTINGPAGPGITVDGGGQVRVMQVASGATLNLNHLTIANGFVRGFTSDDSGAGVLNLGMLTISNSTFSGNTANNQSFGGGGIFNKGTLTAIHSVFFANIATSGFLSEGGGIYNEFGAVATITNSTFANNSAPIGGGIENLGTLTITHSTFSGNNADHSGIGGAITNSSAFNIIGKLEVTDSTFEGNSADTGAGIANYGALIITHSTFANNNAGTLGGGIDNSGISTTVIDSTFSANTARAGGAIESIGRLTVSNSTFSHNGATNSGGGGDIDNFVGSASFKSTILAASSSGGNCSGTVTDVGYNISDDDSCSFSATGSHNDTDPMLDPAGLRKNGGPTKTIALLAGSPAIDAIPLADCTDLARTHNPIITDQRLFPRPDSEENLCDIGAYEFQDTAFIPFSRFNGTLTIDSNTRVLHLIGSFKLGRGGRIDPSTQPVAFSVGQNALRLPVGSFVPNASGYFYQKIGRSILRISLQFTNTPGSYRLLVFQQVAPRFTSPEPVTLTIGDDSGSTLMNANFN